MKTKTFCLSALLLITAIWLAGIASARDSGWAQKAETPNEVDFRVRTVGLGTAYSTVLRQFGKPLAMKRKRILDDTCGPPYTALRLKYSALLIELEGDIRGRGFTVASVEINAPQMHLSPVRIGMTEKEVQSRLGSPWQSSDESGFRVLYYVTKGNDGGARLYFRAGKLMKVHWEATLC